MLTALLEKKREAILNNWFDRIANTYPADSSKLLNKKNQFANPVGSTFRREITNLFDCLLASSDAGTVSLATEAINKVRAVQDFSPSVAVAFIFYLKSAIREELRDELREVDRLHELLSLESAIDGMALIAFDTYTACRERLHEIKYSDFKRRAQAFGGGRSRSNN